MIDPMHMVPLAILAIASQVRQIRCHQGTNEYPRLKLRTDMVHKISLNVAPSEICVSCAKSEKENTEQILHHICLNLFFIE
ncbi:hypothetical protein G9C98_007367 [Cotesia typhae]|uniref:Uncharacterized protein n=1 Tax=Cotesia typhae TaxID=2053667 RepID=A0A8J5QPV1_9HYME|nr:hypothetical protein G9C98_007367 [Cotesia typhae]